MGHSLLESQEGLLKRHLQVHKEVVVDALEPWMRSLPHCEYEVARDHVWDLFGFSFEQDLIPVFHTSLCFHGEGLLVIDYFLTLAVGAVLRVHIAPPTASIASGLHLHLHHAHLDSLEDYTLPVALGALLGLAVLSTCSATLGAVHIARDGHVTTGAKVQFL